MKNILTSALLLVGFYGFAQTTTAKPTNVSTTQTTTTSTLSPKAKSMCKTWSLNMTESFNQQHKPTEAQKNDQLILMEDGHYRMIRDGVAQGGTWTLDKSNVWLTLTANDETVMKIKVIEATDTSLKIDYRDSDDIHNILYYVPATK